jgi:hypothetical protein
MKNTIAEGLVLCLGASCSLAGGALDAARPDRNPLGDFRQRSFGRLVR